MELQELYQRVGEEIKNGSLRIDGIICDSVFARLYLATDELVISGCTRELFTDRLVLGGQSGLNGWFDQKAFRIEITCWKAGDNIEYTASFWCGHKGTLGNFFGNVAPCLVMEEDGSRTETALVADFPISMPVLTFDTTNMNRYFPFTFQAAAQMPHDGRWSIYHKFLTGIHSITGLVNKDGDFEMEVPLTGMVTGIFPQLSMALLLCNGAEYAESFFYPVISQAGLKLVLDLPEISQAEFTVPLFGQNHSWNLSAYFPFGYGVSDIVKLMTGLFHVGGSASGLYLPTEAALNRFRLYRMNLLAEREEAALSMRQVIMEFALTEPWKLPVPQVVLESMNLGFQVSFPGTEASKGEYLLTAGIGGVLSITLGNYLLKMNMEMNLPELNFLAQTTLEAQDMESGGPGLTDMASALNVELPASWNTGSNLLGEIIIQGSGSSRSFYIEAGVYNILSFSIGELLISLAQIRATAAVTTAVFSFCIQGLWEFGEGEDAFSLYLQAAYENPGWLFAGGLYEGTVNIGKLLEQMFQISSTPEDVAYLLLSELAVSYVTATGAFELTAAFEAGWNITLLGKKLVLGGRILISKKEEADMDVSALVYLALGNFRILAQADHLLIQQRTWLFRVEFEKVYLQAAWFYRENENVREEILAVSLGGTTLGKMAEALVNMINSNKKFTLNAPWNLLNKIELDHFLFELNATRNQASFFYSVKLSIIGLMYLDTVGLRYDMEQEKVYFVLTGKLLGVEYTKDNPVTWDVIDGKPPTDSAENEKKFELFYLGFGQHLKNDGITKSEGIEEAMQALKNQIKSPSTQGSLPEEISYDGETNWLFGADFTVNGMVNIKLILNDPTLYGMLATVNAKPGSALEAFDGFGIELLYRRVSNQIYMFRGELLVPKKYRTFQLGVLSITLGTISMEIYTNGGFYVDLGFPHNMDFSSSFVLQWGIFTGRGGIYFGVTKEVERPNLPKVVNGSFSPVIQLGIGLSVGLGRSFDLGIVKGGVSLEVFGIFEGVLAVFHEKDTEKEYTYYYVKAAAGITGRLYLSVDLKIITIQASALVSASAQLILQAYCKTKVDLDLSMELQASIKILFFKIRFSFSFHEHVSFEMGKDEQTPWIEEGKERLPENKDYPAVLSLQAKKLGTERIKMEMVPLFYLEHPVLDPQDKKSFGTAFLMIMEQTAAEQWTALLTEWLLSHFPNASISRAEAEALKEQLADTMEYEVLEEFLEQNVFLSYQIRWTTAETGHLSLKEALGDEKEGYIFPMLPPLKVSFGAENMEKTVCYWKDVPVDDIYFAGLTEYFRELNADPSYKEGQTDAAGTCMDGELPIAKAFFQDYFRMFLREIIGRIKGVYKQLSAETGILSSAEQFHVPVSQLLSQNPELEFVCGVKLVFPKLQYVIKDGDTLEKIGKRFAVENSSMWDMVKEEICLLQQGSRTAYGDGSFKNLTRLELKEAAALLFVRFYEEYAPEDMIFAGDIVRENENLTIEWEETVPGGTQLILPGREKPYITLRGDNPARLGSWLALLKAEQGSLPEWDRFYEDICAKNQEAQSETPVVVYYTVPFLMVFRDLNLLKLSARVYPDYEEKDAPVELLFGAEILKANTPVTLLNAVWQAGKEETAAVEKIRQEMECTLEELAAAITSEELFRQEQTILVRDAGSVEKQWLLEYMRKNAGILGSMLSRFLLQGLRIQEPSEAFRDTASENLVPLYQALQQQFPLEAEGQEQILTVVLGEPECTWVEAEEKQVHMTWEKIAGQLPSGDFSVLPQPFSQMDDFVLSDQYFTVQTAAAWFTQKECLTIQFFSDVMQEVLHSGRMEPELLDENGIKENASFSCILPFEIGRCREKGIFQVYGVNALQRLILHELLALGNVQMHLLYRTSEVSKGKQCFHEYNWTLQESFLWKTNLSVETHMEALDTGNEVKEYLADLTNPLAFMRLLWECSTVGKGGFYLKLQTAEGQSLPDNIFDEDGIGTLWILVEGTDYTVIAPWVNCAVTADTIGGQKIMTLVTRDPGQQILKPEFPAGCIGLFTHGPAVPEEDDTPDAVMRRLFSIIGYQIRSVPDVYRESHLSAPVVPMEKEGEWCYSPVLPVYRYAEGKEEAETENPYRAIGKNGKVMLEARDVLGNFVETGEMEFTPCYNDVLIGIGQWAATEISYSITGSQEKPLLRLSVTPSLKEKWDEETAKQQRKAVWQLDCADMEVELSSPVNAAVYRFSEMQAENTDYLELLRSYGRTLADYLEGKQAIEPKAFTLDFALDLKEQPLYEQIFELQTTLTVKRPETLVKAVIAGSAVSKICPGAAKEENEKGETSLQPFCREAMRVLPGLLLAGNGSGNGLYGLTYKEGGFLEKVEILPVKYSYEENGSHTVQAPEFYALRPLKNGYISRSAKIRELSDHLLFGEELREVEFPEVDMELWALGFLEDVESLLLPEYVQRAGIICRSELNRLIEAKGRLAEAIAEQTAPLRQGAPAAGDELKNKIADRLKRSLKDGYRMDVIAVCRLVMNAREKCRLTVAVKEHTTGAMVAAGKAESGKDKLYLFFDNCFTDSSEPLSFNAVFPELEYAISQDNGYESSSWLKFSEPLEPEKPEGQEYLFHSQVDLPNPLKSCPKAPVLTGHACKICFEEEKELHRIAEGKQQAGWNYELTIYDQYMQQDTVYIRVKFENIGCTGEKVQEQDLFDVLAQYSTARDQIFEGLSSTEPSVFRNAYLSFAEICENAAKVWKDWLCSGSMKQRADSDQEEMVYSCCARGVVTKSGTQFIVSSTEQGQAFLDRLGLQTPVLEEMGFSAADGKKMLVFKMKQLPLYDCNQVLPSVQVVRNQNLLYDREAGNYLPVREEFLYRTQEISLPVLRVSGEYTEEYLVGTISTEEITREIMEQAAEMLFQALQLENEYLMISLGVSWYYGLSSGKEQPRVLLPVTFLPVTEATDETGKAGNLIAGIGNNIFNWYKETGPDDNCCGLLFDLKIYEKRGRKQILHFSGLNVKIDKKQ